MRLKKAVVLTVISVFFPLFSVSAGDGHDFYGSLSDYLNSIYGIDNNSGLTTFPVLNIPMGGRAEGMAGAFSALSDDVSFIEYNPAGSSTLEKSELAFFHNNWIADTKMEGVAYAVRFGDLGIAAGAKVLYTPFTEYNMFADRVSSGYYSEGVVILNASYNFLAGYYFSGLSLGMNLKGAFRIMPDYADDTTGKVMGGSGLSQSAVMAMADVGVLVRFNLLKGYNSRDKNSSAALVIRNLGPPALGEPLPTVATAAISYKPIRPVTLALDFNLPLNLTDIELSEKPYGSLGVAVNVTNFLSMRTGFMLKPGGGRVAVGSAFNFNKLALDVNYTMDFLTQFQPLNRVSIGVRFDLGDNGRFSILERLDELYFLGLEAYTQGNYDDAKLCWEEALRLNPRYEPAKEGLATMEDRRGLHERIEELYKFEF